MHKRCIKSSISVALLAAFLVALAIGCVRKGAHSLGVIPTPIPPNPVVVVDNVGSTANVLGVPSNPMSVSVTGGSVGEGGVQTVQGLGSNGVPEGGVLSVQGVSGGTPLPNDEVPGQKLNSLAELVTPGTQLQVATGAGTAVMLNGCNVGSAVGYWLCYDQAGPDAGGTAGTAPNWLGIYVSPGACFSLPGARSFTNGLVCYSSATAGTLTTASAPNFTGEGIHR